ncbi:MAG: alpha/beta fold hydrolase [Pseudomonadota bacterium]
MARAGPALTVDPAAAMTRLLPSSGIAASPAERPKSERSLVFEPFRARFPWLGPHLQSMRNPLLPSPRLPGGPGRPLALPLGDGDVLSARVDDPAERDPAWPAIVLLHGLGGCETSSYVLHASRFFTGVGARVVRLSLRGAGPSQRTCRDWSHAGRYPDVAAFVPQLPATASGLVLVGFSLGGNLLLDYLALAAVDQRVRAAVSVSAPIDLPAASVAIHAQRNWIYHDYLLRALKANYLHPWTSLRPDECEAVRRCRTLFEVDDRITAPRHGFTGADDYYRRVSAAQHLPAIGTPTALLHAADDPFIPAAAYHSIRPSPALMVGLARGGGHLGFHGKGGFWHLRQIVRFLQVLDIVPQRGPAEPVTVPTAAAV